MSNTFSLVCHETKQQIWVGQGRGDVMNCFYSGNHAAMENLGRFLAATQGKQLILMCDDTHGESYFDYESFD